MAKYWKKPTIRSHDMNESRHATWLELFYDLAFVAAISVIGHELAANKSIVGIISFVALFIPVWWAWLGDTFYNNRFDPEDHGHQFLTLFQMIGIIGLAVFADEGFGASFTGFALSYIFLRVSLAALYLRAGRHNEISRKLNFYDARNVLFTASLWLIAIFIPTPFKFYLAGFAIITDMAMSILGAREQRKVPINIDHLIVRFGLFVVIMLGEIILLSVNAATSAGTSFEELVLIVLAIVIAFSLWWIYFENDNGHQVINNFFTDAGHMIKRNTIAGYAWVFSHLPLSMGFITTAVGIEEIIFLGPDGLVPEHGTLLLSMGLIITIFSLGIMEFAAITCEKNRKEQYVKLSLPFVSSLFIIMIVGSSMSAHPVKLLTGLALVCLSQVIVQELLEYRINLDKK